MRLLIFVLVQSILHAATLGGETKEDFLPFLMKFSRDKQFQVNRITFPLTKCTYRDDLSDTTTITLPRTNWEPLCLLGPQDDHITDIGYTFGNRESDSDERVFSIIGLETGINVKYFFKRVEGLWYLTKIEDYST